MAGTINFLDKIPQIAKSAGVLSQEQIYDVDFAQAVFDEAHEKGVGLVPPGQKPGDVLRQYDSPQKVRGLIDKYNLDMRAVNDKAQMFSSGYESKNSPYFMDTLQVFGHITAEKKQPLLAAQFSARTAETVHNLRSGKAELSLDEALTPMRPPRADEAGYLRAAQNIEQTAKILAAAIVENPSLKSDPDIQRAMTSLEILSAQGFEKSAGAANAVGMGNAASDMEKHQAGQQKGLPISKLASTSALVEKLETGMNKAAQEVAKKDPAKGKAIAGAMASRKSEMREMKVFGSMLLPDFMMKKTKLSFVDQVNNSRSNGQSGGRSF